MNSVIKIAVSKHAYRSIKKIQLVDSLTRNADWQGVERLEAQELVIAMAVFSSDATETLNGYYAH